MAVNVLDEEKVREIRVGYEFYELSITRLSRSFGVTRGTVRSVVNRESWSSVDAPCEGMSGSVGRYAEYLSDQRRSIYEAGYFTVHARLRRSRGSAKNLACVDCGGAASQWSFTPTSDTLVLYENITVRGKIRTVPFSRDPLDYRPRCRPCHAKFDWSNRG